jgi:hypothetical protein
MSEPHSGVLIDVADHAASKHWWYADLADRVATQGPAAVEGELRGFLRDARRRNVTPVLVAILADASRPDVARQRAFGRIHAELERHHRSAPPMVPSDAA